jgi:predicted TIM-barrel fold metal-dependent hydrolase
MAGPRIDVHHHYVTAQLVKTLADAHIHDVGGQPLVAWRPDDSLATMDRYEIDAALLSAPVPLAVPGARSVARALNEAGAEAVARAPGRFGLLAALPLPDVDAALDELSYALEELRADGILLLSNHAGVYLGDARFEPIFDELDRRRAVVLVHPAAATSPVEALGPSLFEFPFDTTRAAANLIVSGTLERHPEVRMVLAHAGGTAPYLRDRIVDRAPILQRVRYGPPPTTTELTELLSDALADGRRQLERLFYDVTLSANDTVLGCLSELVPAAQILLGTDFPLAQEIGVATTLSGLARYQGFDVADRRAIESANALRLFPRLAAAHAARGGGSST